MKKLVLSNILLLSTLLFLISCGNSIENDIKKMTELQCEVLSLSKQALLGDKFSIEKLQELNREAEVLMKKLQKKYTSSEDRGKIGTAQLNALLNCN